MNRLLNYWLPTKPEIEYYQCKTCELEVCEQGCTFKHDKFRLNVSSQLVGLFRVSQPAPLSITQRGGLPLLGELNND